jgi:hypothetical protein
MEKIKLLWFDFKYFFKGTSEDGPQSHPLTTFKVMLPKCDVNSLWWKKNLFKGIEKNNY